MHRNNGKRRIAILVCVFLCMAFMTPCAVMETAKEDAPAQTQAPKPTEKSTPKPTEAPTPKPTEAPTAKPTEAPTAKPTEAPTAKPTEAPTAKPTEAPTEKPTEAPTATPHHTEAPTAEPTSAASAAARPTHTPEPTSIPVLPTLTAAPTDVPEETLLPVVIPEPTKNIYMTWYGVERHPGGGMDIPAYFQTRYTDTLIVVRGIPRSVASSGCGPTTLSMVIAYLTGDTEQNPESLFMEGINHGYYNGGGFSTTALRRLGRHHGVKMHTLRKSGAAIKSALRSGQPVIVHMGPGIFTKQGHYVVLRGLTSDGKVLLNDPISNYKTGCAFPIETILAQATGSEAFMACSIDEEFFAVPEEPTPEPTVNPEELPLVSDVPILTPAPDSTDEVEMEVEFILVEEN